MKRNKKAQIWISVIIYTLVAVAALALILSTGIPILTEMKDRAVFTKTKDLMSSLDQHIREIANQGEGSQSLVSLEVRDGNVKFSDNELIWEIQTDTEIISPRTSQQQGDLIISSNANIRTYDLGDYFLINTSIKDDTFSAKFHKIGSRENPQNNKTSEIIDYIRYNDNSMDGNFTFLLNNNQSTDTGVQYTEMFPAGNNSHLGRAMVVAHVDNNFGSYDLEFVVESNSDFVTTQIRNFKPK